MRLPANQISTKVQASGISGSVVVVLLYLANRFGIAMPAEVASAIVVIVTFLAGYLTEEKAFSRRL